MAKKPWSVLPTVVSVVSGKKARLGGSKFETALEETHRS
jgi:hypothetical protein